MEIGIITLFVVLAIDIKIKQRNRNNISSDDYQSLSFKEGDNSVFMMIGVFVSLLIIEQYVEFSGRTSEYLAMTGLCTWMIYCRLRLYIAVKKKKINAVYTKAVLQRLLMILAGVIIYSVEAVYIANKV